MPARPGACAQLLLMVAFRGEYFHKAWFVLDMIVTLVSLASELCAPCGRPARPGPARPGPARPGLASRAQTVRRLPCLVRGAAAAAQNSLHGVL